MLRLIKWTVIKITIKCIIALNLEDLKGGWQGLLCFHSTVIMCQQQSAGLWGAVDKCLKFYNFISWNRLNIKSMGKENCVIEIMSEYLRKRERIYFFKVASALKPYVAGSTSKSPTQQLLGFPFAQHGEGGDREVSAYLWVLQRWLRTSGETNREKCCRLQTMADVMEAEEEKRGKQGDESSVFQLNIAIQKKLWATAWSITDCRVQTQL